MLLKSFPLYLLLCQEAIVTSEEIGKDYEHVEAQQKKFDDFEKVRLVQDTWVFSLLFYIKQWT